MKKLIAALSIWGFLVACALFVVAPNANAEVWSNSDGTEPIGDYGTHYWYGERQSLEYSFVTNVYDYCGHPETGYTYADCRVIEVTGRANGEEFQAYYGQLPQWLWIQNIWESSGNGPARISLIPNPYAVDGSIAANYQEDTGQEGCGPNEWCGWWGDAYHLSVGTTNSYGGVASYFTGHSLAWNELYFSGQAYFSRPVIVLGSWTGGGLPLPPAEP